MNYTGIILLIILAITNGFDLYFTHQSVIENGITEANPIADFILNMYGFTGLIIVKFGLIAVLFPVVNYIQGYLLNMLSFTAGAYCMLTLIHYLN